MGELDAIAQALSDTPIVNAIEFADVTLAFGARTVLAGIDLAIRDNEFIGVLGPNGSGKTTMMRAILGLLPPRSGAIRVLGRPVARGNPAIGYMPQMRGALDQLRLSRLGLRRKRRRRPPLGHAAARPRRARCGGAGPSIGCRRQSLRGARWRKPRAASVSACCWPRRCSAARVCCCSTNR